MSSPFSIGTTQKRITKAGSPRQRTQSSLETSNSRQLEVFVDISLQSGMVIHQARKRKITSRLILEDKTNNLSIKRPRKLFSSQEILIVPDEEDDVCYLDALPKDVIISIFKLLPALSRGRISLVCSRWNSLISGSRLLNSLNLDSYGALIKNSMKHSKPLVDYIGLQRHPDITPEMRSVLVDWIIEVGEEFKMQSETVFLAVNIIDLFLSKSTSPLVRNRFQLLGITAILIAAKLEEMYAPTISDLVYVCDNTYTLSEIINMEGLLVNALSFDLTIFNARHYVQHYIGFIAEDAIDPATKLLLPHIANYLIELAVLEYSLVNKRPSLVASSAIYIARQSLGLEPWPSCLQRETYYISKDLEHACQLLLQLHRLAPTKTSCQAAFIKYSQPKYQRIAARELY